MLLDPFKFPDLRGITTQVYKNKRVISKRGHFLGAPPYFTVCQILHILLWFSIPGLRCQESLQGLRCSRRPPQNLIIEVQPIVRQYRHLAFGLISFSFLRFSLFKMHVIFSNLFKVFFIDRISAFFIEWCELMCFATHLYTLDLLTNKLN